VDLIILIANIQYNTNQTNCYTFKGIICSAVSTDIYIYSQQS